MTMEQGYVQVYTGDGKGKTTAAVGLAMRAAAANLRVCFCQFMKCGPTGELDAFRLFGDLIACEQFGTAWAISGPTRWWTSCSNGPRTLSSSSRAAEQATRSQPSPTSSPRCAK